MRLSNRVDTSKPRDWEITMKSFQQYRIDYLERGHICLWPEGSQEVKHLSWKQGWGKYKFSPVALVFAVTIAYPVSVRDVFWKQSMKAENLNWNPWWSSCRRTGAKLVLMCEMRGRPWNCPRCTLHPTIIRPPVTTTSTIEKVCFRYLCLSCLHLLDGRKCFFNIWSKCSC